MAHQSPLPRRFPRQEYWKGLPSPAPGDLPNAGIEPASPALAGGFLTTWASWEAHQGKYDPPNIPPSCSDDEGRGRGRTIERKSTKANRAPPPNALTEKGEEI